MFHPSTVALARPALTINADFSAGTLVRLLDQLPGIGIPVLDDAAVDSVANSINSACTAIFDSKCITHTPAENCHIIRPNITIYAHIMI
jgi:hypothetical protein